MPAVHPALLPWPRRWVFALKLDGWPKLLAPALLGHALGIAALGAWDPRALLLGLAHAAALAVAIVLLNDYTDRDVDALKRQLYPVECSPKTIPDGVLGAQAVLLAGIGAAILSLAIAGLGAEWLSRPGLALGGLACLACFLAYSCGPVRLNYRGGGEFLEMLGVGALLPAFNAYLQAGALVWGPLALVAPGLMLLALASAISSGLADEVSDRRGGKTTFVTLHGNAFCRALAPGLVTAGAILWALAGRALDPQIGAWLVLPALLALIVALRELLAASPAARTHQLAAIRVFKGALNRGVAAACILLAIALVLGAWLHRSLG